MRRLLLLTFCVALGFGCSPTPRDQLDRMGVPFSVKAMMSAAEAGDRHVVGLLLEAGMTPNGTDARRRTVLAAAAAGGSPEVLEMLLAAGADPSRADEDARTPLMEAVSAGHAEATRVLLRGGANPRAVRADGMTVLMQAAVHGNLEVLDELLLRGLELDERDPFGRTALHHATAGGHSGVVGRLLEEGASPSLRTRGTGEFALGLAAAAGDAKSLALLAAAGADLERRDFESEATALWMASAAGHAEAVAVLLESGADPTATDRNDDPPLVAAARAGHTEAMARLLAHGVDPDAPGQRSVTPLMFAAAEGHLEAVSLLLESGADPSVATEGRYSALRAARREGHDEIAIKLEAAIEQRRRGIPGARRWARFGRYADAYHTPPGWSAIDPLTSDAPLAEDYSLLGVDPAEGLQTRRALLASETGGSQILLVRGARDEWSGRLAEGARRAGRREVRGEGLRTADGVPIELLALERSAAAGEPARRHLLAIMELPDEVLIVDAGGPSERFDATLVEDFLTSLRVERGGDTLRAVRVDPAERSESASPIPLATEAGAPAAEASPPAAPAAVP